MRQLGADERLVVAKSLERFNEFLSTGQSSHGFRLKKINGDKYEFRASSRLRVVVKAEEEVYYLVLAGNHEDVRRYLRNYR